MIEYNDFQKEILAGIPDELPEVKPYDPNINHAPKRKDILTKAEKKLAIRNALRYFPEKWHATLAPEFAIFLASSPSASSAARSRSGL